VIGIFNPVIDIITLEVFNNIRAIPITSCNMSRNRYINPRSRGFVMFPRSKRGWCFCATAVYGAALLIWMFASTTEALANMTDAQCQLVLLEFSKTFVQPGDGYPSIDSCDTRIMGLMWDQQISRVYSVAGKTIETYNELRLLPDEQFAKLVVNAAAGSLLDTTQTASDDAMIRIRVNSQGHFRRYVLNDSSRITSLQTMLVISIVTLAVTWWKLATNHSAFKSG
jgi:hypothetical protein